MIFKFCFWAFEHFYFQFWFTSCRDFILSTSTFKIFKIQNSWNPEFLKSRILEIQNSWNPEFLKSRILEIQNLLNSWRGQFPSFGHLCSRKHFHWQNIFSNSLPRLGSSVCLSHFISSDGSFGIVGFAFRWLFRTFRPEHSQAFWSFELYLAVSFKFQLLLDWGTYLHDFELFSLLAHIKFEPFYLKWRIFWASFY